MTLGVEVWVGGYPLSTLCGFRDVSWVDRFPYGNWDASWTIDVPRRFRHPAIRVDATVEIRWGKALFTGRLLDPDWETGSLAAAGLIRSGEGYPAYDRNEVPPASGTYYLQPSVNLEQAIDDAVAGGPTGSATNVAGGTIPARTALPWKRTTPLWTADVYSALPDEVPRIFPELVDLAASRGAGVPYMGATGRLQFLPMPTTPSWITQPDVIDLAEAGGEERATTVWVTFLDSTSGGSVEHTRSADTRFLPHNAEWVDARGLGAMTPTEADAIADAILAEHLKPVFTTDIPLTPTTVTTLTGAPCFPPLVQGGQAIRVQGATHPRLSGNHIDVVIGEVSISNAETATPTGVAKAYNKPPRTEEEVMEQTLTAARKALAA